MNDSKLRKVLVLSILSITIVAKAGTIKKETIDTLRVHQPLDSIFAPKKPLVKTRLNYFPIDSSMLVPKTLGYLRMSADSGEPFALIDDISVSNERSVSDWWNHLPGIYSVGYGIQGQPAVPFTPVDPRGIKTVVWGRDNSDPIYGNVPVDFVPARGLYRVAGGPFASGPLRIEYEPILLNTRRPVMRVDYRDGYYGSGRVDFRYFQPLTSIERIGACVSIDEADGRYYGAESFDATLLFSYLREPITGPSIGVFARQHDETGGFPYTSVRSRTSRRYDIDLIMSSERSDPYSIRGTTPDTTFPEKTTSWRVQTWWTKSTNRFYLDTPTAGSRVGVSGRYSVGLGNGTLTSTTSFERKGAALPPSVQVSEFASSVGVGYLHGKVWQKKFEVAAEKRSGFSIEPTAGLTVRKEFTKYGYLSVYAITEPRFPTFYERYAVDTHPEMNVFYEPTILFDNAQNTVYGNSRLDPFRRERGGLTVHLANAKYGYLNLSGVLMKNSKQFSAQFDTLYDRVYDRFAQTAGRTDHLASIQAHITPYLHAFSDIQYTFRLKGSESRTYLVPTYWGYCAVGWKGSWKRDALDWTSQVRVRSIGPRLFAQYGNELTDPGRNVVDLLISVRVYALRINWGATNFLHTSYNELPGFPAMHKEEVWGITWHIWE